jgi:mRNA interferase HigB
LRIVTEKRIREYTEKEPASRDAMNRWIGVIQCSGWRNPGQLKTTFATASFVGGLTVFNVAGNKYRLVAFIHYRKQIVYVKRIGTHQEYDTWEL